MTPPVCPNCSAQLAKMPTRKTKCRACGQPVFLKSTPENREKVLMTEAQAAAAEAAWSKHYFVNRAAEQWQLLGVNPIQVRERLLTAQDYRSAWIDIVLDAARSGSGNLGRFMAWREAAAQFAEDGDRRALECLRGAAAEALRQLSTAGIRRVKVEAGYSQSKHKVCWDMGEKLAVGIDEALSTYPLPNPACPNQYKKIELGYCTCSYKAAPGESTFHRFASSGPRR